ncbi:MAG: DUF2400 family protein [archaeon GBS-70-058]|nr:DUF2400 family protein [Candidatus Culexarchaeum nevadense]
MLEFYYVRRVMDEVYDRLCDVYLGTSVLGPVRVYSARDVADREFWALFCALVDFQMPVVSVLNPMLTGLAKYIEKENLAFLNLIYDFELAEKVLRGFVWYSPRGSRIGFTHRFVKISDVISLFAAFRWIHEVYGSLGSLVRELYARHMWDSEPMDGVLRGLLEVLQSYGGHPPLVPKSINSPLKRLNLFFRWLVRPYPDMGLWSFIDKTHLFVSLDQGLQRVLTRAFQLKVPFNWRGVLEATKFLRKINPEDPTKYDYVLSRISIMGYCAKNIAKSQCYMCPLINLCNSSKSPKIIEAKPLTPVEMEILEDFLKIHGREFDKVITEYTLGKYSADAFIHAKSCIEYIVEVERELNYTAIGQAVTYRYLYYKHSRKIAKPMIICRKASKELKEAAQLEQGIEVIEVPEI